MNNTKKQVSAVSFQVLGREFLDAAEALQPPPKSQLDELRMTSSRVPYYLLGHSIELSLKAFLRCKGIDVASLKRIGHDLKELLSVASRNKLDDVVKLSHDQSRAIDVFSERYSAKKYEYFIGAEIYAEVRYGLLFETASVLSLGVKPLCGEDYKKNYL